MKRAVSRTKNSRRKLFLWLARITLWASIICAFFVVDMAFVRTYPVAKPHNFITSAHQTPEEISIPTAHIDLPIIPATFTNGTFQTTTKGVSYLTSSPIPGNKGNSVLYAHNWINLFGNLPKVKKGDTINIIFSNKSTRSFTVSQTQTVSAYTTSILQPTDNKQITLFTCTNFLDADRFVVTAISN